jgi:hypothetical protein
MIKQTTDEKHYLNLAGEYGVCSELAKRGIMANLTFGHHKAADVLVVNTNSKKAVIVEVKTTRSNRVVTSFFQKYKTPTTAPAPDFWIIVQIGENNLSQFYILSHQEMAQAQMQRNKMSEWKEVKGGVDNILIEQLESTYKNNWQKLLDAIA